MNIDFQNITVALNGQVILNNLNLCVPSGRVVGLIGANGSGKSTLLKTVYRVHSPNAGKIVVDGTDLYSLSSIEAAKIIAVMAQENQSGFPLTAHQVALLGRVPHQRGFGSDSPHDLNIVRQALADAGAGHLAHRAFDSLSGGEKQRVLLARALAQETPILLLDEPTNHADLYFQHELMHIVASQGKTVMIAIHDVNLALIYCDDVAVLESGKIKAFGPSQDVLQPSLIDDILGVHSCALEDPRGGSTLSFRRVPSQNPLQSVSHHLSQEAA